MQVVLEPNSPRCCLSAGGVKEGGVVGGGGEISLSVLCVMFDETC